MDKDCPFCTSVKEEGRTLREGKYSYVVFSNPRVAAGHLLVIPYRHVDGKLKDLTKEEWEEISSFLFEFQTKILERVSSGCDIRQNFKPYLKNSATHVNHMHWHIQPREVNDPIAEKDEVYRVPLYTKLDPHEVEHFKSLLKN